MPKPTLTQNMRRAVERLVLRLQAEVGGGYHPDTRAWEYTNDGPDNWSREDLQTIDLVNQLTFHVLGDDVYKACLEQIEHRRKMIADVTRWDERVAAIREWLDCSYPLPENRRAALVDAVMAVVDQQLSFDCDDPRSTQESYSNAIKTGRRGVEDYTEQELIEALAYDTATTYGLMGTEETEDEDQCGLTVGELKTWLEER